MSFFISTITMKVLKLAVSLLRTINCSRHNKNLYFVYLVLFHLLVYSSILILFLTRFTCIILFTCVFTCLDFIFDISFTCIILFTCVFTCLDFIFNICFTGWIFPYPYDHQLWPPFSIGYYLINLYFNFILYLFGKGHTIYYFSWRKSRMKLNHNYE